MSGKIVHSPSPKQTHKCDTPYNEYPWSGGGYTYPKGTVWRCDECGRHWKVDSYLDWARSPFSGLRFLFHRKGKARD